MSTTSIKNSFRKIYYWAGFIILYIILFEFLIPNSAFPKPSIIFESVIFLQGDYDFLFNLFYSLSGIYLSIIISFLLLSFSNSIWISFLEKNYAVTKFLKSFLFFPLMGLLLIVVYNFPVSIVSEYILWIVFSLITLLGCVENKLTNVKSEYIESFQSIAIRNSKMLTSIKWKLIQPEIFDSVKSLHLYLWSAVIIFEFLKNHFGIGHIYNIAFQYKDYTGIIALSFIVMVLISAGNFIIGLIKQKYFFWEQ